jgi:KDO2-lipid IV(A) lauroyltransferase
VGAEFAHIPEQFARGFAGQCRLAGAEHLPKDAPALFISAHAGNWEWMAQFLSSQGYRLAGVARPMNHPGMEALVLRIRGTGLHSLPKDGSGNDLVRVMREGYFTAVLIDQSPRENGVPCTFFGAPCWGTIAPVMLAVRARVPVVPVSQAREADGTYTIRIHAPVPLVRTGDLRRDLVENTQRCQDAVEAIVREHPGQWLWFHRRWKERPRLAEEWEARVARDQKRQAKVSAE